MKRIIRVLLITASLLPALSHGAENWKGKPYDNNFDLGGMAGLGILDGTAGFEIRGTAAAKVLHRGFFPDVNNQLYVELQPGIIFLNAATGSGSSAFTYSLHLRWDFHLNDDWTFYGLGGFGGTITGATLGDRREFHPRFGMGARWNVFANFGFRFEISHEFTGLGVTVPLPI